MLVAYSWPSIYLSRLRSLAAFYFVAKAHLFTITHRHSSTCLKPLSWRHRMILSLIYVLAFSDCFFCESKFLSKSFGTQKKKRNTDHTPFSLDNCLNVTGPV